LITFLVCFLVFFLWHGFGVTIGYHRLLSHRSFRCRPFFEYFLVVGAYLAFQGSPIWWAAIHRAHHRYSDTDLDPHTPRKGVRYALLGWLFDTSYLPTLNLAASCKDLIKDDFYRMLEPRRGIHPNALNLLICLAYRGLLLAFFGWTVFWANMAASFFVFAIPQLINVVCHLPKVGYQNFRTGDDSRNVWWLSAVSLGDGWHNNHHAYPGSTRHGVAKHEFDPSWQFIRFAQFCGLVTGVNEPEDMMQRVRRPRKVGALARLQRLQKLTAPQRIA
jgi:fatty-acid desaturase